MIFFNGVSSDDVHVVVEHYPSRPVPQRKQETFSVPGRSGDIIMPEDAWENVIQTYDIYISAERESLPLVARKAVEWLMVPGYQVLEDSYDLDCYRMAAFTGGVDLENTLNIFGRATISFNCKPQRFLKSGAQLLKAAKGTVLVNPSVYTALPLIVVHGTGSGTLTVGQYAVQLSDTDNVTLDCEAEEAYRGGGNLNNTVMGEFPRLTAGKSVINWSGGIRSVDIMPRWFVL